MPPTLRDRVMNARILICVGGGGVGKTTLSAALGLYAARQGRDVVVVTIDPARRLAGALGLESLEDEPRRLDVPARGALYAMMLDKERAWDRLIGRHAPDPGVRERILANRMYRELSRRFAGTHEYLAMEELCRLVERGGHDLIVLDTPPAPHAFGFLDAPAKVRKLLDRRLLQWLLVRYRPGTATEGWLGTTAHALFSRLEAATGASALEDVSDLFTALASLFDAFAARAKEVTRLLHSPTTALAVISGPDERSLEDARACMDALRERKLPPELVLMNRAHRPMQSIDEAQLDEASRDARVPEALRPWLLQNHRDHAALARGEARRLEELRQRAPKNAVVAALPNLDEDVHELGALGELADRLGGAAL